MVLMNGTKRTRYTSSIVNRNQGGGSKKAGFPAQIGRESWTNKFIANNVVAGRCCKIKDYNKLMPLVNISRPIGRVYNVDYWHIPGTKG